jgi:diguanylate cyclase (GGDEF)-like protein
MTAVGATILVVDDEPQNLRLLTALLKPEGYIVRTATDGDEALASVAQVEPDLILLDVMMPGKDGYEVARALKSGAATAGIPIIMVSAHSDRQARLRGLEAGAEDFLTKPVDRGELWLRIRNLLRLKELSDQLQNQSAILEEQVQERTADLHRLAHYDALTGLPNRMLFFLTLQRTLALAAARRWSVAVAFIDVDHLKDINDTQGHAVGDQLLAQFGDRLTRSVRVRDTVGRLGGDEFAMILMVRDGQKGAAATAHKVREAMRAPFVIEGHELKVTASIGITLYPDDSADAGALIRYADTAMYRAKESGRDTFRFFTAQMNDEVLARLELEMALRAAIDNHEFVLHYQPKVDLNSGRVAGVEALIRWQRPGVGLVPPMDFIPILEDTGLIVGVGSWVIAEACSQVRRWMRGGVGPVPIAVNVSGRQLLDNKLETAVAEGLSRNRISPELLELELTESSLMANTDQTIARLEGLKRLGVRLSVDDFGTGYSSLAYLRRFPIDKLKIDLSFVRDITTSPDDAAIALTIIRMAHGLRLDVIAEGVETVGQLEFLRRHRCDQIQGYLFSPPLPARAFGRLVREGITLPPADDARSLRDTLLIVDDEPDIGQGLPAMLGRDGYHVLVARSADEAFELLAMHPVQVILCDPRADVIRDTDFLDRAKELHPDALRIVLSGYADTTTIMAAINRGAIHRYYIKPWVDRVLRDNIREAFRDYWLLHDVRRETAQAAGYDAAHARLSNEPSQSDQIKVSKKSIRTQQV